MKTFKPVDDIGIVTATENLRAILDLNDSHPAGLGWYYIVHDNCQKVCDELGLPMYLFVGLVAAYSINQQWEPNWNTAVMIAKHYIETGEVKQHGLKAAIDRVNALFAINPDDEDPAAQAYDITHGKNGLKVARFFATILNPYSNADVVADRWVWRALGWPFGRSVNKSMWLIATEAFRIVADERNMRIHEIQAQAWVNIRGEMF